MWGGSVASDIAGEGGSVVRGTVAGRGERERGGKGRGSGGGLGAGTRGFKGGRRERGGYYFALGGFSGEKRGNPPTVEKCGLIGSSLLSVW